MHEETTCHKHRLQSVLPTIVDAIILTYLSFDEIIITHCSPFICDDQNIKKFLTSVLTLIARHPPYKAENTIHVHCI